MIITMNINPIIEKARKTVDAHKLAPGKYTRYIIHPETGEKDTVINAYGCADAANILYTIDEMPKTYEERKAFADALKSFQNPETGLFDEGSHHPYHGTAHVMGALELFDEMPLYPLKAMDELRDESRIPAWLKSLNWSNCRGSGHIGAGVFSSFYLERTITDQWMDAFFGWLTENADPEFGINIKGMYAKKEAPVWLHMGDWFHFLFCFYAARRSFPFPEKLIDSCLDMYQKNQMDETFGKGQRFLDIDWAFTLNRAANQCGHRLGEVKDALRKFAKDYTDYLLSSDETEPQWNDIHLCFGAMCAVTELQCALPGKITSHRSLRQILERRPFI